MFHFICITYGDYTSGLQCKYDQTVFCVMHQNQDDNSNERKWFILLSSFQSCYCATFATKRKQSILPGVLKPNVLLISRLLQKQDLQNSTTEAGVFIILTNNSSQKHAFFMLVYNSDSTMDGELTFISPHSHFKLIQVWKKLQGFSLNFTLSSCRNLLSFIWHTLQNHEKLSWALN